MGPVRGLGSGINQGDGHAARAGPDPAAITRCPAPDLRTAQFRRRPAEPAVTTSVSSAALAPQPQSRRGGRPKKAAHIDKSQNRYPLRRLGTNWESPALVMVNTALFRSPVYGIDLRDRDGDTVGIWMHGWGVKGSPVHVRTPAQVKGRFRSSGTGFLASMGTLLSHPGSARWRSSPDATVGEGKPVTGTRWRGCGTESLESSSNTSSASHRPRPRGSSDMVASCGSIPGCSTLPAGTAPRGRPGDATRTGVAPISRNLNDATASLPGWDQTRT
jgi:hypothetical protein